MKSFKALNEQKEHLSRELADSCRDYIDLKLSYNEVVISYQIVKDLLAKKVVELKEATTTEEAFLKIRQHVSLEMMKSSQLDLDFPITRGDSQ